LRDNFTVVLTCQLNNIRSQGPRPQLKDTLSRPSYATMEYTHGRRPDPAQ
jgi:hypothetical protein